MTNLFSFDVIRHDFHQFRKRHRTRARRSVGRGVGALDLAQVFVVKFPPLSRIAGNQLRNELSFIAGVHNIRPVGQNVARGDF